LKGKLSEIYPTVSSAVKIKSQISPPIISNLIKIYTFTFRNTLSFMLIGSSDSVFVSLCEDSQTFCEIGLEIDKSCKKESCEITNSQLTSLTRFL
jgi:hypothetical protein